MAKPFLYNIEVLRGFAALMVFISHTIMFSNVIQDNFYFREKIVAWAPSGHLMVMIFFVLSGFVIGLIYKKNEGFSGFSFIKKRLLRLFPIYCIVVFFTGIFFKDSLKEIFLNLLFCQNLLASTLDHNGVLWSLNHEMFYYVLAIPIIRYKLKMYPIFFCIFLVLLVSGFITPIPIVLEGYLVGFTFWLSGYLIGTSYQHDLATESDLPKKMLAMFFLVLACDYLNFLNPVLSKIHFLHGLPKFRFDDRVLISDFCIYPFSIYAVLIASGKNERYIKWATILLYLLPLSHLFYLLVSGNFFKTNIFIVPTFFLLISILIQFKANPGIKYFKWLGFLGSISYAFYLFHYPILLIVGDFNVGLTGSGGFIFKTGLILTLTIFMAFLLEQKFQPWIKQRLTPAKSLSPWYFCLNHSLKEMQAPKLSVIVPSYNQGAFLEETLLSIIRQDYPNLELIVIDGGSADNSVEIIKKHEKHISYWVSEKDRGQSHAINKGLEQASGEWVAWINSDDCYLPGALDYIFSEVDFDKYDFLYGNCFVGETIDTSIEKRHPASAKADLKDILLFFHHVSHIIPSQSVFIRKSLIDKVGYIREDLHYCMDFEWFCRMYLVTDGRRFFYDKTICFYRVNEQTKTGSASNKGPEESMAIALEYSKNLSPADASFIRKMVKYFGLLRKQMKSSPESIKLLLSAGIRYPLIAMRDVRYKTMLKRKLKNLIAFSTPG